MALLSKQFAMVPLVFLLTGSITRAQKENVSENSISGQVFSYRKTVSKKDDKITLHLKKASLLVLYDTLNKLTSNCFLTRHSYLLSSTIRADVHFVEATIGYCSKFIEDTFRLEASLVGQVYVLKPKTIAGVVRDTLNNPIPKAMVWIKGTGNYVETGADGRFMLYNVSRSDTIEVSAEGKETMKHSVDAAELSFILKNKISNLHTVYVTSYSDGYREVEGYRATGAVIRPDIERYDPNPSAVNFIDALTGLIPQFNRHTVGNPAAGLTSPRGATSIHANQMALVTFKGFPFMDNPNFFNKNDLAPVSFLKDAHGGSVWGSFSGNGSANFNPHKGISKGLSLEVRNSFTIAAKPAIDYDGPLDAASLLTADSIAAYSTFTGIAAPSYPQQLYAQQQKGTIDKHVLDSILHRLRSNNLLKEISREQYRPMTHEQHFLSVKAGNENGSLYAGFGYDNIQKSERGNGFKRYTAMINSSYQYGRFLLELTTCGAFINEQLEFYQTPSKLPYLSYRNPDGSAAAWDYKYPPGFTDMIAGQRFLDWRYIPLHEAGYMNNNAKRSFVLISPRIVYTINDLKLSVAGKYSLAKNDQLQIYPSQSFYARDLVNLLRQPDSLANYSWPLTSGDIADHYSTAANNCNFRAQADHKLKRKNYTINSMLAVDVMSYSMIIDVHRKYASGSLQQADFSKLYEISISPGQTQRIPNPNIYKDSVNNFLSGLVSIDATIQNKYVLSFNGRSDQSNRFTNDINKWGIGLWSAGAAWNISDEPFLEKLRELMKLRLRVTYGLNGNIDYSIPPYQTISQAAQNDVYRNAFPLTPGLGWEKLGMWNFGVDFMVGKSVKGSVEYFLKRARDLLHIGAWNPTTGFTVVKNNSGSLQGKGLDIDLRLDGIKMGRILKYYSQLRFSHIANRITSREGVVRKARDMVDPGSPVPMEGYGTNWLFAYRSAGLNPATGAPRGYLGKEISEDYFAILNNTDGSAIRPVGSLTPTSVFNFSHTFTFNRLSLSVLFCGRLGYYGWAKSINYDDLYNTLDGGHKDFHRRWQSPGDEKTTSVPALIFPLDPNRDLFNDFSEDNVIKGDNIKLQNIQLAYKWEKIQYPKLPIKKLELIVSVDNLGMVYKANDRGIDPDVACGYYPLSRSITLSVNANF